jgi:hypothetical protein
MPSSITPIDMPELLERYHADLTARHSPVDAVEHHWVEELAFALWRQHRLREIEARVLAGVQAGTNEPESHPLPDLGTITRYRTRIQRDIAFAEAKLSALKALRPERPQALARASAARLRWLTERAEAPANDDGTSEPEPPAETPPLNRADRWRLAALARSDG